MAEPVVRWYWQETGWQQQPPVPDRGAEFGDGLFETIRLNRDFQAPLLALHWQRLLQGLVQLDFPIDTFQRCQQAWHDLMSLPALQQLAEQPAYAGGVQLKLLVSRCANDLAGPNIARGYAKQSQQPANFTVLLRPAPVWLSPEQPVTAGINPVRLASQPLLAGIKHLNRLEQVLARAQFQPGWQESLMLSSDGDVVEGCMSNLYLLEDQTLVTPLLEVAGVNGVVRRWLFNEAAALGVRVTEGQIDLPRLYRADGLLFSNTLNGFSVCGQLDQHTFSGPGQAATQLLCQRLQHRLQSVFVNASGNIA